MAQPGLWMHRYRDHVDYLPSQRRLGSKVAQNCGAEHAQADNSRHPFSAQGASQNSLLGSADVGAVSADMGAVSAHAAQVHDLAARVPQFVGQVGLFSHRGSALSPLELGAEAGSGGGPFGGSDIGPGGDDFFKVAFVRMLSGGTA